MRKIERAPPGRRSLQGVVYGIVGTAFAQGSLAGIGFWLAGVPGAFLLGVLTAFLSVIPKGPVLLWLPATEPIDTGKSVETAHE